MSAHRLPTDMHESSWTILDPGNAGTITVYKDFAQVPLASAGAETRTLARPTRSGVYCQLYVQTYVGAITLTVTGNLNVNGTSTFVFGAAGQWALFVSQYDGTNYYWELVSSSAVGNLYGLQRTPITAITTLTVTAALHANRTILLSLATGFTSTLPLATGTGNKYRFIVNIIPTTSSTYVINAAGSDVIKGSLPLTKLATVYDTANTGETFTLATAVTVTIGGTNSPKGGASIGDWVEFEDVATAVWQIQGFLTVATTPTTPFS